MAKNINIAFYLFIFFALHYSSNFLKVEKNILKVDPPKKIVVDNYFKAKPEKQTDCLLETMQQYIKIGVVEIGGNNKGPYIDQWLGALGFKEPAPWCAAYTTAIFNECNIKNPNSAWSPSWDTHTSGRTIWTRNQTKPTAYHTGMIFTLYYKNLGRVGHVGMIEDISDGVAKTNEGNVTYSGTRETQGGKDGVMNLRRDIDRMHKIRIYDTQKPTTGTISFNGTNFINYSFNTNLPKTES